MNEAKFWQPANNKNLICELCHQKCVISPEKTGLCRARVNNNAKLFSTVYGYPAALNIDPVEKKPLFHFMPGSFTYSVGTYGCNFACGNCQNWQLSQAKNIGDKTSGLSYVSPEKIIEEALGNECRSISYTYNEPTIFSEYALDIMKLARQNNLKNIWVSNGYMTDACLDAVIPYLDAINVDLKSYDEKFYLSNCQARLEPVLKNLVKLKRDLVHLEITTLIVPTLTDSTEMLKKLSDFIVDKLDDDTPWHISKFSPENSWRLKTLPPTPDIAIYNAYETGKQAGLKYVYVGNIPGDQKENTYCPACGELAIHRFGYDVERMDSGGRCPACDKDLNIID